MNQIKYSLIACMILLSNHAYSQEKEIVYEKEVYPFIGLNAGKYFFAEPGIALGGISLNRIIVVYKLFVANEFKIDKHLLIGPKLGGWVAVDHLYGAGLNFIYYSGNKRNCFVLRPEIGKEFRMFRITYGYNVKLNNSNFDLINTHLVGINFTFQRRQYFSLILKKNMRPRRY